MYDDFSADYDRFVDWASRLAAETPFLTAQLEVAGARDVLDTACGTGMHAIALSARGYDVWATDASPAMVDIGRRNAEQAGESVSFLVAALGDQTGALGLKFDAVLCLGNSLPHVLTRAGLDAALADMASCLNSGGIAIIQNRNFDAVLATRERWMSPQGHDSGDAEWVFVRFYDYEPDGLLTFNVVTLRRSTHAGWTQHVASTKLWAQTRTDIEASLKHAGFERCTWYGDLQGSRYLPLSSPNLVVVAQVLR
jgi:SAM-dependent methyltransferase